MSNNKSRKKKKKEKKKYLLGNGDAILFTYAELRQMYRKQQVDSIALARKEHRNFWTTWAKGYPNRTRTTTYFKNVIGETK